MPPAAAGAAIDTSSSRRHSGAGRTTNHIHLSLFAGAFAPPSRWLRAERAAAISSILKGFSRNPSKREIDFSGGGFRSSPAAALAGRTRGGACPPTARRSCPASARPQHEVGSRLAPAEQRQRRLPGVRRLHRVPFSLQQHAQQLAAHRVVVDDQHTQRNWIGPSWLPRKSIKQSPQAPLATGFAWTMARRYHLSLDARRSKGRSTSVARKPTFA